MALSHSLAWALLYSLWQGLVMFGFLYVLLKAIPSASARLKYNLSLGAFVALFAWFANTWVSQYHKLKGTPVYITTPTTTNSPVAVNTMQTVATPQADGPVWNSIWPSMEQYYSVIILLYAIGLLFMLFRLLVNMGRVRALRTQDIMLPSPDWAAFVAKWQARFNISRPVKLFLSARITVPVMMGALKPVILLPVATINHLSAEQVEAILLHELAHIRRHDYLLNMLQAVGEAILFFNPFIWLISAVIRREREHCCDDLVVDSAADPLPYARALAILESNRQGSSLALAATGNKNQLFNRIKRIMEMKKNNLNNSQLTIVVVAILALTLSVAMLTFTPSFAQKAKKEKHTTSKRDSSSPKKVYKYKTVVIDNNGGVTENEYGTDEPEDGNGRKNGKAYKYKTVVIDNNGGVTENVYGTDEPVEENGHIANEVVIKYRHDDSDKKNPGRTYTKTYKYESDSPGTNKKINLSVVRTEDITNEVQEALVAVHKELKDMDWVGMYEDIEKALAEIDKEINDPKLRKQIKAEIEKELANAKKEMQHAKKEILSAHREIEHADKERQNQRKVITKKITTGDDGSYSFSNNDFETMLDEMAGDKLIDKSKAYVIRKSGSELFINGKKQPNGVYEKYSRYLKYKTVDVKGKEGTLNVNIKN